MREDLRLYTRRIWDAIGARSPEEREKRAASLFALLLVGAVATVKYVSGWTVHDERFTLYLLAVAGSAAYGGFVPGLVATLASFVCAGFGAGLPAPPQPRLLFVVEGVSVAFILTAIRNRVEATEARLAAAQDRIADLKIRDRQRRVLDVTLRHLEEAGAETAVVVLNDAGIVVEWRTGAERLYGYTAEDLLGVSAAPLFFHAVSTRELTALLQQAAETGAVRRSDTHRRRDGSRMDVEIELKPFRDGDARGFTLAVRDLATRREWDEYRAAAGRAQCALEQAANDAQRQLAALESLTDPALNPFGGAAMVTELLERLRATVGADGVALVRPGPADTGVVAARGLQPVAAPSPKALPLAPGRVTVVHNDPARVEQMSALRWSASVASLLVVPVMNNGRVWSTIEVVHERSRHVTDWDVALARVVADRLAAVVAPSRTFAARAS